MKYLTLCFALLVPTMSLTMKKSDFVLPTTSQTPEQKQKASKLIEKGQKLESFPLIGKRLAGNCYKEASTDCESPTGEYCQGSLTNDPIKKIAHYEETLLRNPDGNHNSHYLAAHNGKNLCKKLAQEYQKKGDVPNAMLYYQKAQIFEQNARVVHKETRNAQKPLEYGSIASTKSN